MFRQMLLRILLAGFVVIILSETAAAYPDFKPIESGCSGASEVWDETNAPFPITIQIDNVGDEAGSIRYQLYISVNSVISEDDSRLFPEASTGEIQSGGTFTHTFELKGNNHYLDDLTPGSIYYWGIIADSSDYYDEENEDNNDLSFGQFEYMMVDVLPVDSQTTGPSVASIGELSSIEVRIDNDGSSPVGYHYNLYYQYYLSTDSAISSNDIPLNNRRQADTITAGGSYTSTDQVRIPDSISPGVYYWGIIVDSEEYILEENEENNDLTFGMVEVSIIDLAPSQSQSFGPDVAAQGDEVSLTFRVDNLGSSPSGDFRCQLFISSDSAITDQDHLLDIVGSSDTIYASSISGGDYFIESIEVRVPNSLSDGTYYWGIIVDTQDSVDEEDEDNNDVSFGTVSISSSPGSGDGSGSGSGSGDGSGSGVEPWVDISPGFVQVQRTVYSHGPPETFELIFFNTGNSDSGNVDYSLRLVRMGAGGSWDMKTGTITSIPADSFVHHTVQWEIPGTGHDYCLLHELVLEVESENEKEEYENNNEISHSEMIEICPIPNESASAEGGLKNIDWLLGLTIIVTVVIIIIVVIRKRSESHSTEENMANMSPFNTGHQATRFSKQPDVERSDSIPQPYQEMLETPFGRTPPTFDYSAPLQQNQFNVRGGAPAVQVVANQVIRRCVTCGSGMTSVQQYCPNCGH